MGAPYQTHSVESREAAESIDAEILREQVFVFIAQQDSNGATDEEQQLALGMGGNTQRPRRRELQLEGRVMKAGFTRPTTSGRNAAVWIASQA